MFPMKKMAGGSKGKKQELAEQMMTAKHKGKKVMGEFKRGELHSGSKKGPVVKDKKQALAIMMSEKRKALNKSEAYNNKWGV